MKKLHPSKLKYGVCRGKFVQIEYWITVSNMMSGDDTIYIYNSLLPSAGNCVPINVKLEISAMFTTEDPYTIVYEKSDSWSAVFED